MCQSNKRIIQNLKKIEGTTEDNWMEKFHIAHTTQNIHAKYVYLVFFNIFISKFITILNGIISSSTLYY